MSPAPPPLVLVHGAWHGAWCWDEVAGGLRARGRLTARLSPTHTTAQLEALATADAFESMGLSRREALWLAGNAAQDREEYLPGTVVAVQPPLFELATDADDLVSDLWATGISPDDHPVRHVRELLSARGALSSRDMATAESGRRIEFGGVVTHRQRPATAAGVTFLNLEDESGMLNVVCSEALWKHYRVVGRNAAGMIIRGILERSKEGVVNLMADKLMRIEEVYPEAGRAISPKHRGRDFQ